MENLLNWTRDSHNKLMFTERIEKYALFKNPQVKPYYSYGVMQATMERINTGSACCIQKPIVYACGVAVQLRVQHCVCVGGMEVGQSFKASKGE